MKSVYSLSSNIAVAIVNDFQFVWGVIEKNEKYLNQLPPGPTLPGTFLHFSQQGDFSDAALAAFDPEALQIVQSLRQQLQMKDKLVLSEWHDEWSRGQQQQKLWVTPAGPSPSQSLLAQPTQIDVANHGKIAQSTSLNYWGTDEEAPVGTLGQMARWAKEAEAARNRSAGPSDVDSTIHKGYARQGVTPGKPKTMEFESEIDQSMRF